MKWRDAWRNIITPKPIEGPRVQSLFVGPSRREAEIARATELGIPHVRLTIKDRRGVPDRSGNAANTQADAHAGQ